MNEMNETNETRELVGESINRIFSERVDRKVLEAAEKGVLQEGLWKQVMESGFTRSLVPEESGGGGLSWPDAYPLMHALGFWRAPVPLVETLIGTHLLARAGLPCDMDGPVSPIQVDERSPLTAELSSGKLLISGTAKAVPWARQASHFVVGGSLGGKAWLALLDQSVASATVEGQNIAFEPRDQVSFNRAAATAFRLYDSDAEAQAVRLHMALGRAISIGGAAQSALTQSVRYAQERQQFGRPIGKFQAVQHMLAIMACDIGSAAAAANAACDVMHKVDPRFSVSVAKVRAGQAAGVAARNAHQVHGAFGMTYEHTLHFATKRMWAWRAEYGNETTWARELGAACIRRGGAGFWAHMTRESAAA